MSRAVPLDTSAPKSSSISASARSIPEVMPADVHTWPSLTKILSSVTCTFGKLVRNLPAKRQCVVAWRPSRSPAAARRKLPVQMEATRRTFEAEDRISLIVSGLPHSDSTWGEPTTTRVSGGRDRTARFVITAKPELQYTRSPPAETTLHSYLAPCAKVARFKAQSGPLKSSNSKPGKTTSQTDR